MAFLLFFHAVGCYTITLGAACIVPNRLYVQNHSDGFGQRWLFAIIGHMTPVVGILKEFCIQLKVNFSERIFLIVEGSSYDWIVGDRTMERLESVLDL